MRLFGPKSYTTLFIILILYKCFLQISTGSWQNHFFLPTYISILLFFFVWGGGQVQSLFFHEDIFKHFIAPPAISNINPWRDYIY